VLAAFAVVFIALEIGSYVQESAIWDEPGHITAGYAALARQDFRTDPEHPPFLRMWAALPLLMMPGIAMDTTPIDRAAPADWVLTGHQAFAHRFMYVTNDADRMLYRARFMIVLLGVLLGVLVFMWVHDWLGFWPAVAALVLYTVEPNLAAHASLVTTDFGLACFFFGAIYCLWRTTRRASAGNIAGVVAFFVLAMISKYSAILLAPVVILLLVVTLRRRTLTWVAALTLLALLVGATWIGIWAMYDFRFAPSSMATWRYTLDQVPAIQAWGPTLTSIIGWIDAHHVLPNAFSEGFLIGQVKLVRPAFLAGQYSDTGWWYYFPVALLIKTPISLMLLASGGMVACLRRWRSCSGDVLFVIVPVVLFLGAAMTATINIGVRHVLPIMPFVIVLAAAGVHALLAAGWRGARITAGVLVAIAVVEYGSIYPRPLTFFNLFVGGPAHGAEYLVDSNIDWGQDLKALKHWMDAHDVRHINLAYFGSADPAYYHIDCTYLPGSPLFALPLKDPPHLPGYVALSATSASGVNLGANGHDFYKPLRDRAPVADIGHSIRVYWVDKPWW
jgi:hypothetical protein